MLQNVRGLRRITGIFKCTSAACGLSLKIIIKDGVRKGDIMVVAFSSFLDI